MGDTCAQECDMPEVCTTQYYNSVAKDVYITCDSRQLIFYI